MRKNPSQSWVEIKNKVHLFVAGERSHPQINEIYEKIESFEAEFKNHGYLYQAMGKELETHTIITVKS